ncbi:MAG: hypothetical protein RLZZ323_1446 [Bacteroidota bacterium]|jgi:hypothetical protein
MKKYFTLLFCFSVVFIASSQELSDKETDDVIDSLFENNKTLNEVLDSFTKYQFLYLSMNYNDKTYFSGRDIGVSQFSITPKISYLHYSGLSATVSGAYYNKFDPKWDLSTVNIGYGKSLGINNIFRYYTSYTRYFYNNGVSNSFENDITLGFGVKNKKKTLGTQLSGSYLFGKDHAFQLASTTYALFRLVKNPQYRLDFRPQFSIISGYQTVELSRTYIQNERIVTDYTTNKIFSLINKQLNLPLQFNGNSFDFELGYNLNFPSPTGTETGLKNTSFFNFSVAYLFDL